MPDVEIPRPEEMYAAVVARDTSFDGIFFTCVRTTGVFCRPSCPAKRPLLENVEFHPSAKAALAAGFRPCKRCRPLELPGLTPPSIARLLREVDAAPDVRILDRDLRARDLDPAAVRRWFQRNHAMTFHAYQRGRRLARALEELTKGASVTDAAYGSGYESLSGFRDALRRITGRPASESRSAPRVHLSRVLTPLGPMLLGATDAGVCLLEFTDRRMLETQLQRLARHLDCVFVPGSNAPSSSLEAELAAYFAGELREFRTPLALHGTEFQERAWSALSRIPFAATRSYAEQARSIGAPSAVRAVARANGDNRISIVIPCHRVIGSDGALTGYGGGLWRKRWLLQHERAAAAGDARHAQPR